MELIVHRSRKIIQGGVFVITNLKEIMAQNVETVGPDVTLKECAEKMKRRNVGVLPVIDGKKPIGVITDRDITLRAVAEGADVNKTTVRDVMTRELYSVYEDQTIKEACGLMEQNKIRRLVVVNREGGLAGVLTLNDVTVKAKDTRRSAQVIRRIAAAA
jgi:CBS domain-containing protein